MCRRLAWDRGERPECCAAPFATAGVSLAAGHCARFRPKRAWGRDDRRHVAWMGFHAGFSFLGVKAWLHEMSIAPFCGHEPALLDVTYPASNSYEREIVRSTSRARFLLLSPYLAIIRTNVLYMVELFSNSLLRRTAFSGRLSWVFPYLHFLVPECIKNATRLHWRGEA